MLATLNRIVKIRQLPSSKSSTDLEIQKPPFFGKAPTDALSTSNKYQRIKITMTALPQTQRDRNTNYWKA